MLLASLLLITKPSKPVTATNEIKEDATIKQVQPTVKEVPLILQEIARCESGGNQFNKDGTVKRGVINPKDVGKFQINEFYHLEDSRKLGMDIYTLQGNTEYALHLYKTQGTKPWNWSKHCWGNKETSTSTVVNK